MGRQDARVVRVAAIGPSTGRGGGASETGEGSALWGRALSRGRCWWACRLARSLKVVGRVLRKLKTSAALRTVPFVGIYLSEESKNMRPYVGCSVVYVFL